MTEKKSELIRRPRGAVGKPIEGQLIDGHAGHIHMGSGTIPVDNPDCPSLFANVVHLRMIGGAVEFFFCQPSSQTARINGQNIALHHCIARVSLPANMVRHIVEALKRTENDPSNPNRKQL